MRYFANCGKVNYEPNTLNGGKPREAPSLPSKPQYICGNIEKKKIKLTNDFQQAGEKYRSYDKEEKDHLIDNLVNDLWSVEEKIQLKVIEYLTKADREYGERVRKGLKIK
jgi:catalase